MDGPRDYYNYGTKSEANAFAKFNWDTRGWHLYSDNQLRTTDFRYHGDVAIDPSQVGDPRALGDAFPGGQPTGAVYDGNEV